MHRNKATRSYRVGEHVHTSIAHDEHNRPNEHNRTDGVVRSVGRCSVLVQWSGGSCGCYAIDEICHSSVVFRLMHAVGGTR